MRSRIESLVSESLERVGIDIRYAHNADEKPEKYMNVLEGAISVKKPLNIIQIGANDGKYNDPIYDFVKKKRDSTNIILIEPLESLVPYLKENYEYHPSVEILNKAVGEEEGMSFITLYRIKREYWDDIDANYGEGWPEYRVPTGVTTSNKDQLLQWVSENVQSRSEHPEQIIEKFEVEIIQPDNIINKSEIMEDVQVLQVDTEGMDDKVVYSFLEDGIRPNIINIERTHLSKDREKKYHETLVEFGYEIHKYESTEKLALL